MYSQYIDGQFHPVEEPHVQEKNTSHTASGPTKEARHQNAFLGELTGGINQLLGGIQKQFKNIEFDIGDILLILIILFLLLEGDNLELVITLGLMLLLGFNDD